MAPADASGPALLVVLLGDVVLPRGGAVWASALGAVMEHLQVNPAATRQALRRLAGDGLLASELHGRRARYALTATGRQHVAEVVAPLRRTRPARWDGQWRVLAYRFPESDRAARDRLRRDLDDLGYGTAGTGTWVSPWDVGPRLGERLEAHRHDHRVARFTATFDGDDRALARQAFDLDEAADRYQTFLAERRGRPAPDSDVEAVAHRVALVHDWVRLEADVPTMPEELLPDEWPGRAAREHLWAALGQLEPRVSSWWAEVEADVPRTVELVDHGAPAAPAGPAPSPDPAPAPTLDPEPARSGPAWTGFRRTVVLSMADDALLVGHQLSRVDDRGGDTDADEAVQEVAKGLTRFAGRWYAALVGDGEDPGRVARGRAPDDYRHAAIGDGPVADLARAVAVAHVALHGQVTWLAALARSDDADLQALAVADLGAHRDLLARVEAVVARRARDPHRALETSRAAMDTVGDGAWMFEPLPGEAAALDAGVLPAGSEVMRATWWEALDRSLRARHLVVPEPDPPHGPGGRRGLHGPGFLESTWPALRRT